MDCIDQRDHDWFLDLTDEDFEAMSKESLEKRYGIEVGQPLHRLALDEIQELEHQVRVQSVITWVASFMCALGGMALMAWVAA